jgi:hypothetical protein
MNTTGVYEWAVHEPPIRLLGGIAVQSATPFNAEKIEHTNEAQASTIATLQAELERYRADRRPNRPGNHHRPGAHGRAARGTKARST